MTQPLSRVSIPLLLLAGCTVAETGIEPLGMGDGASNSESSNVNSALSKPMPTLGTLLEGPSQVLDDGLFAGEVPNVGTNNFPPSPLARNDSMSCRGAPSLRRGRVRSHLRRAVER
jgi:hypothetical protein